MSQSELRAVVADARALLSRLERLLDSPDNAETMSDWVARWFVQRQSVRVYEERLTWQVHIAPLLGGKTTAGLTREDLIEWVRQTDQAVRDRKIRAGTARRRWALLRSLVRDMCRSKQRDLRVRPDDVAAGVPGPDHVPQRAGTYLYPSEFLRLVRCSTIPLKRRRLYAIAVYLAPRAGELAALTWEDIDVRTRRIHIHRSMERETHVVKPTKTGYSRQFIGEPPIVELLAAIRGSQPGEAQLVPRWDRDHASERLRQDLERAKVTRADLYAVDDSRRHLVFHDLRATGITWWAMRGDSVTDIMERAGHTQMQTTQVYMRRGRLLAKAAGEEPFPDLPLGLRNN